MQWYVSQRGDVTGPMDAASVRMAIDKGTIGRGVHVRDEGGQWTPIEQSPFGDLLSGAIPAAAGSASGSPGRAAVGTLVLLLLLGGYIAVKANGSSAKPKVAQERPRATVSPQRPKEPTLGERLASANKLSEAISILQPFMTDTNGGKMPVAAAPLGLWARERMQWSELEAMPDSRRADVMKDPESYRGKRICTSGRVIEIHADRSVSPPVFNGGLMTSSYDMLRFLAVRSTGNIVEGSVERFCGIIIGLQSYPNARGGTTHAVYSVGMFDLPENRAAAPTGKRVSAEAL